MYAVAPAGQTLPVPAGLDMLAAASLPEAYFTVWSNVFDRARLSAGESLLVSAPTSSGKTFVGEMAIANALAKNHPEVQSNPVVRNAVRESRDRLATTPLALR